MYITFNWRNAQSYVHNFGYIRYVHNSLYAIYWMYEKEAEIMTMTEKRKEYLYNYQKEKLKRVPLDLKKEEYEKLLISASAAGTSINGYIKQAITEKIERDGLVCQETLF